MNKKRELTTPIRLRQRDKNSHTIHASIFDHGVTYDLSKKSVQFNASKPDGTIIQQSASITGNAIEYTLPDQATAVTGKVKCYFSILDSSGNVVDSTATFYLEVEDAINLTAGSKSYIESIDAIKSNFESKVATINAQLDKVQQDLNNKNASGQDVLNRINKIKSDAESALAKLNSDAQTTLSGIDSKITSLVNDKWNTKSADLDTKYNSHIKELDGSWNTLRDKALQQSNEITNKNNQASSLITSITNTKNDAEKALEKLRNDASTTLSNLEKSANSLVAQAVADSEARIAGNLIDPNLNNWSKSDVAQQAFKSINFDGTTNSIAYQGAGGTEVIYTKLNLELYKHYKLRFRFTPKSDIRDLQNGTNDKIKIAIWRTLPGIGPWGGEQGTPNLTSQIKDIAINQDKFYEIGFYSDNAKELYFAFNFHNVKDGIAYNFEINSISVVNIENTIQSLADSSYPRKFGSAGDDLFSYKNNHEIRIYDNVADVKNKPSSASNWFVAVIDTVRNSWGNIKVFCPGVGSWQIDLAAGNWNSWFTLFDSRNAYSKSEIDKSFVKSVQGVNPDASGNVNLPRQTVIKSYDFDNNTEPSEKKSYVYGDAWLADSAIIKGLINWLPKKYAGLKDIPQNTDLNSIMLSGIYGLHGQTVKNLPNGQNQIWATMLVMNSYSNDNTNNGVQIILNSNSTSFWYRGWNKSSGSITFLDWSKVATSSDFANYYNKPEIDNKFKSIVLNIVDFGAKAEDSNFDNAPAFNRAIQSLPSTGGIIYIPNGNFFLKSTVTIDRSYVHIMGLNHGLRSGIDPSDGTTQTGGGGAKVTVQNSISAFKIQNTHNDKRLSGITFSGFDLKGDTNGGVGIDGVSNTDRVVIDNMTINNIGTGVKLNGADAPRITNSWIAETKSSIQLTGASQQAEIKNNSLGAQPQGITILLENADRYNISSNNIYPDGSSAIRLLNPVHGAIVGNTISAYYTGIIEMLPNGNTYGNGNTISSNTITIESWKNNPIGRDNKWGIIHIEGYDNLISSNNILANGSPQNTTGILIMKGDRNKIASNILNIPNSNANVVCNGSANNTSVVYSTKNSSFQNGLNNTNTNIDVDSWGNYYNKSEIDGTINVLKNRCEALETQLAVLKGQMSNLLSVINVSNGTLIANGTLSINGQIKQTYGGTDQFVAYAPNGTRRGYFGFYDGGDFVTRKG